MIKTDREIWQRGGWAKRVEQTRSLLTRWQGTRDWSLLPATSTSERQETETDREREAQRHPQSTASRLAGT